MKKSKIPGASVAFISQSGQIIQAAVGIANRRTQNRVTETTIFEAASLSKPFFAFIVLKMIERGQFSRKGESPASGLDRPLHEITHEFGPPALRSHPYHKLLTVRKVLSHQTGLPNWFLPDLPENYDSKPGDRFDYSGLAFCFLNDVLEKVSGKTLAALAQDFFKQLQMNHSSFLTPKEYACGHDDLGNPDEKAHFLSANPAASLFTTAGDYAKFLQACLQDKFVQHYLFQPQITLTDKDQKALRADVSKSTLSHIKWGLGFGLQTTQKGDDIAFHWGDNRTSTAFTAINLQTGQAVVCFTNSTHGPRIFKEISEPVVGDLSSVWQWLSGREQLALQPIPEPDDFLLSFSLFKKLEEDYLIEHRHEDEKLQQEYDKRFGLIEKK